MGAIHVRRSAQAKRGPLTQSLTSPYGKVKRSAEQSASSGAGQDTGTSLQAAGAPGLPALPSAGQPRNERHPCPVGPSQRGPLTQSLAPPRSKARGPVSRSASSGAGQDMRTSLQATGHPGARRCCPQDNPGMGATHVRGRPKPKRPLNAKPRTAAQQSQGESVEVRILRRRTGRGNIAASGRARTTNVAVRRTASEGAPPMSEVGPSQRGPLTQSLAPPRSKARGKASRSASSGAGQDAGTSLPVAAPGLRRCCPQDSLGRGASHVRGRPKPKRPLNAKPRIAAQQG